MSSTMMMERTGMGMPGMGVPTMGTPAVGAPTAYPTASGYMMVPRCTLKFEKCQGGMKITASCDDKMACSMVQNLCSSLVGGMCSCCCTLNGVPVYSCNLTMGMCKYEMTESGCCITCTSGDQKCCEMLQCICDSLTCMVENGCTCCVLLSNTPVCCGCCESGKSGGKPAKPAR